MAEKDTTTTLKIDVPECELQALLYSLHECSWTAVDLLTLVRVHAEDGGGTEEISPSTIEHLTYVAARVLNKQMSLVDILSTHLGVSDCCCERTFKDISNASDLISTKPISAEYKRMLDKSEVAA